MPYIIKDFRVNALPGVPVPNSRYYVPNGNGTDLNEYLTDLTGAYRLVGSASSDELLKISSNDTTSDYLISKLISGTGINLTENNNGGNETLSIINTAPDQTVVLTEGGAIDITGTYPSFTIAHEDTSSISNLSTTAAQVIENMTFDTFGHVQTLTTRNLTLADLGGDVLTFDSGLTRTLDNVQLGGTLLQDTILNSSFYKFEIAYTLPYGDNPTNFFRVNPDGQSIRSWIDDGFNNASEYIQDGYGIYAYSYKAGGGEANLYINQDVANVAVNTVGGFGNGFSGVDLTSSYVRNIMGVRAVDNIPFGVAFNANTKIIKIGKGASVNDWDNLLGLHVKFDKDLVFNNYPSSRNDGTATKFLTVDATGNVQLRTQDLSAAVDTNLAITNLTQTADRTYAGAGFNYTLNNLGNWDFGLANTTKRFTVGDYTTTSNNYFAFTGNTVEVSLYDGVNYFYLNQFAGWNGTSNSSATRKMFGYLNPDVVQFTVQNFPYTTISGFKINYDLIQLDPAAGNLEILNLTNLSTQNRLLGQFGTSGQVGYITLDSTLSLVSGVLAVAAGGTGYIQNQNVSPQTANYWIQGLASIDVNSVTRNYVAYKGYGIDIWGDVNNSLIGVGLHIQNTNMSSLATSQITMGRGTTSTPDARFVLNNLDNRLDIIGTTENGGTALSLQPSWSGNVRIYSPFLGAPIATFNGSNKQSYFYGDTYVYNSGGQAILGLGAVGVGQPDVLEFKGGTSGAAINAKYGYDLAFQIAGGGVMYVTSTNKVIVNTFPSNPAVSAEPFQVHGTARVTGVLTLDAYPQYRVPYIGASGLVSSDVGFYFLKDTNYHGLYVTSSIATDGTLLTLSRVTTGTYNFFRMQNAAGTGFIDFGDAGSSYFYPYVQFKPESPASSTYFRFYGTDAGAVPVHHINFVTQANGTLGTQPLVGWYNNAVSLMQLNANGELLINTTDLGDYKLQVKGNSIFLNPSDSLVKTIATGEGIYQQVSYGGGYNSVISTHYSYHPFFRIGYKTGLTDPTLLTYDNILEYGGEGLQLKTYSGNGIRFFYSTTELVKIHYTGQVELFNVPNATVDTDKFLVLDGSQVKYRTGAELLSDIGATALSGLTAATATNTINNTNYAQEWQWNTLNDVPALFLSSNSTVGTGSTGTLLTIYLNGGHAASGVTTYGLNVLNSHSGTSSINVAARFAALSGTTNYALIVPVSSGFVGIGTDTPASLFTVSDDAFQVDENGVTTIGRVSGTTGKINLVGVTSGVTAITVPSVAFNGTFTLPPSNVAGGVWTDVAGNGVLTSVAPTYNLLTRVTKTADYTTLATDQLICYTTLAAPRTVTLIAASSFTGKTLIIKDESGNASTNNIIIAGTIDGSTTVRISNNYGWIKIYSNGTAWFQIG